MGQAWTPERGEELRRHAAAGHSANEIATLLDISRNAVLGRAFRLGIPVCGARHAAAMRNRWTPERDEELRRHAAAGRSAREIAAPIGTTRGAVLGRAHRFQIRLHGTPILFWTAEREEELKRYAATGLKAETIAQLIGTSRNAVVVRARRLSISLTTNRRRSWTPERDEELMRHAASGLSASKIAALLQTTRSAVLGRTNRLRGKARSVDGSNPVLADP